MSYYKKILDKILFAIFLVIGFLPMSFADSSNCDKATRGALKAYDSNNKYDKFLAVEALEAVGRQVNAEFVLQTIDPLTPFLARSAISTVAKLNKVTMTQKLLKDAAENEEISTLLIETLQHETLTGSEFFIEKYLLNHTNKFDLIKAMKAIAQSGNTLLGKLLVKNYKNYSEDKLVQSYALYAIVKLKIQFQETANEVLLFANNTDPLVREMAAIVLGELKGKKFENQLNVLVSDNESRVNIAALTSLLKITGGDDKRKLITLIKSGNLRDAEIAAGSLKRLPSKLALEIIKESLIETLNIKVSLRVMESIAALKGGDAIAFFNWGLSHKEENIVIQTLFAIGDRSLLPERNLLVPFLESEDTAFRSIASWAYLKHPC